MARACIVGWAHTPFGKLEDPDVESLMARVSGEALSHAGVGPGDVDGIYVGVMNNGFSKQGFEAARLRSTSLISPTFRPPRRECVRDGIGCPLHGPGLRRERPRAHRPGRRRREDDGQAVAETSDILLSASYRKEEAESMAALPACSGGSRRTISSATATAARNWPGSPPRTTGTASRTPTRRCGGTSASSSATPFPTRTPTSRRRCGAPTAR